MPVKNLEHALSEHIEKFTNTHHYSPPNFNTSEGNKCLQVHLFGSEGNRYGYGYCADEYGFTDQKAFEKAVSGILKDKGLGYKRERNANPWGVFD